MYDSLSWIIKEYNGDEYNMSNLPFSIVNRTLEPVYNIRHTLEFEEIKKYVSVSGAPLFDKNAVFKGAVFFNKR